MFREVNERVADITRGQQELESEFLCGVARLRASLSSNCRSEYEQVRAGGDVFLAAPGHRVEGIDRLVEGRGAYAVLVQI